MGNFTLGPEQLFLIKASKYSGLNNFGLCAETTENEVYFDPESGCYAVWGGGTISVDRNLGDVAVDRLVIRDYSTGPDCKGIITSQANKFSLRIDAGDGWVTDPNIPGVIVKFSCRRSFDLREVPGFFDEQNTRDF